MGYSILLKLSPLIVTIIYSIITTVRSTIWGKDLLLDEKATPNIDNAIGFIVLAMFIAYVVFIINKFKTFPIDHLYIYINLIPLVLNIYRINAKSKVTNKGIIYHNLFLKWNSFICFSWNNNLLELTTVNSRIFKIDIPTEEKDKIDCLLSKHINTNVYSIITKNYNFK